jgi:hypothetical protein
MPADDLYVPHGSFLKCDKGASVMQLTATPKKHNLYGLPIATETDNIPLVNIPTFAICSVDGKPCIPMTPKWMKTHEGAQKVLGKKPLLVTSYCKCMKGGNIEIFLERAAAETSLEKDKKDRVDGIPWLDGLIGGALFGATGSIMNSSDEGKKITQGLGRGIRKGLKGTWNFLSDDMWKADTWKGMGKMAAVGIVGYGSPVTMMIPPEVKLQAFDDTFGTDLNKTHQAIGNAISDTWDKKVVNGTTEERSELAGQTLEMVIEAVAGSKGAGLVAKGAMTGAKMAIGAERIAEIASTITKLRQALKLEELAGKVMGIFKVGRKLAREKLIDDVAAKAEELIQKAKQGIPGFSNKKNGPCLSGVYDPKTKKTFFGQNFEKNVKGNKEYADFVENAHPIIKERIKAQQKLIDEGKMPAEVDKRAGAHSEVRALDEAIKAREAQTGKPVTEKDLGSFDLHNRHMPSNTPFNRCPNCSNITNGANTIGGHN